MIPWGHIVGWRSSAPWISRAQVEQDLIMSRALVAIFQESYLVDIFRRYMEFEGNAVDGRTYEQNLREKMKHPGFASDIEPLLPDGASYDLQAAFDYIVREIVSRIDKVENKNGKNRGCC